MLPVTIRSLLDGVESVEIISDNARRPVMSVTETAIEELGKRRRTRRLRCDVSSRQNGTAETSRWSSMAETKKLDEPVFRPPSLAAASMPAPRLPTRGKPFLDISLLAKHATPMATVDVLQLVMDELSLSDSETTDALPTHQNSNARACTSPMA